MASTTLRLFFGRMWEKWEGTDRCFLLEEDTNKGSLQDLLSIPVSIYEALTTVKEVLHRFEHVTAAWLAGEGVVREAVDEHGKGGKLSRRKAAPGSHSCSNGHPFMTTRKQT